MNINTMNFPASKIIFSVVVNMFLFSTLQAQSNDSTQFATTDSSAYEDAALVGMTALTIPVVLGITAISIVPPSFGVLVNKGTAQGMMSFETGVGFGRNKRTGRFADTRFIAGYTHVYNKNEKDFWRVEISRDFHAQFIDKRKIFLLGASPSVGYINNGSEHGYSVGAQLWLMTPTLSFIGFFPLHTFGISYRYNTFAKATPFHTLSLGISSAFMFGW